MLRRPRAQTGAADAMLGHEARRAALPFCQSRQPSPAMDAMPTLLYVITHSRSLLLIGQPKNNLQQISNYEGGAIN